jgi:thiol:disulfide interchange protein DsbA
VKLKTLIVLATVLQVACGGGEPAATMPNAQGAADRPATETRAAEPAAQAAREPVRLAQADTSAGASISSRFEAGTHYQTISPVQPTSTGPEQVEVTEFFMYSCIHCYNFDPYLEEWKTGIPDYVNFVRVPTVWNSLARIHGQAFYTAEALGKKDEMHADFFREIHVNGNALQTEDALAEFFGRFDVSREEFERTFNSFAVHAKVQRADELMRRYRVSSTPTMVINGKYRADGSMAGGYDTLIELID